MEEYWNCRNYTVESKLGEYPGVFLILTILLIISSFLFWVLRCFFNSIEDHRMNINIFLNKRITELLICHIYIWSLMIMWSSILGPLPLIVCKTIRYSAIVCSSLTGDLFLCVSTFRLILIYKNDWIMEFDQEKMARNCYYCSLPLAILTYLGFLVVDIKRGTVHASESFASRCPPTEEQDYVTLGNIIMGITYLTVFISSNIILTFMFRNADENLFQNFRVKTVTIGITFVAGFVGIVGMFQFLPIYDFDVKSTFFIIIVDLAALALYIIKENEFTYIFILNLSLWNRCRNPNGVGPLPLPAYPLQELNPRALGHNVSGQNCRIIDLEDDGGIFVG